MILKLKHPDTHVVNFYFLYILDFQSRFINFIPRQELPPQRLTVVGIKG